MRSFFHSQEAQARLMFVAGLWRGTPWSANSQARGQGVSCHNLPRAIYVECGALTPDFPIVARTPAQGRHVGEGFMEKFVDGRPEFRRLDLEREVVEPGDLLGLRIYRTIDHLGVALPGGAFVHVLMHKNTCLDVRGVTPWLERTLAAWRIES